LVAGRIPGERIATAVYSSDSSTFTSTETEIAVVTAALVSGRTYRIRFRTQIGTTNAGDTCDLFIREDNSTGNTLTVGYFSLPNAGARGNRYIDEVEYTATASGNKTFSVTCLRAGGSTGTLRREAETVRPSYLYVDYIRG
jgi:hypothetical protein